MELYPAIDLLGGRVVRLLQGDYDSSTVYSMEPVEAARSFLTGGARNLHIVDLDGARTGAPVNHETIRRVCALRGLFIEVGGGIRTEARIESYLEQGVGRVILGTIAARKPEFALDMAKKYGAKIAVGVDAKDGKVAVSGWLEETALDSIEFCRRMYEGGVSTVIYTDISRDGALKGANLDVYAKLSDIAGLNVIASGGVSSEEDLLALYRMKVYGAIVGKALYEGRLTLKRALEAAKGVMA